MTSVEVRWRRPGEDAHFYLRRKAPGGDADGAVSVELLDISRPVPGRPWWDDGVACPVLSADHTVVRFDVPAAATAVRLRFTVTPQVNGVSGTALVVHQAFAVRGGKLAGERYLASRAMVQIRSPGPGDDPIPQRVPTRSPQHESRSRSFDGLHPLLTVGPSGVLVDTEFLDVTELWWGLHYRVVPKNPQPPLRFNPWFLHPGVRPHARPDDPSPGQSRLAVLVNTRFKPMIWFATVPEVAVNALPADTSVGGYLFFRPPGGNPFTYSSDHPSGLADPVLGDTGMATLCRYLLSGHGRPNKGEITGLPDWPHLLDHVERVAEPRVAFGALPCGMERTLDVTATETLAANRTVRILFMPQRSQGIGYGDLPGADVHARMDAAIRLLWSQDRFGGPRQQLLSQGAIGVPQRPQAGDGSTPATPLRLAADHWLGCYSRSGDTMWSVLDHQPNRARAERVVVFDATNFWTDGVRVLRTLAKERGRRGLRLFLAWSPFTIGRPPTQPAAEYGALGAKVTVIPEKGPAYFRMPPNPDAPWVEYIFADNAPFPQTKGMGYQEGGWWHQIIAFAGEHLDREPSAPGSRSFMRVTMSP